MARKMTLMSILDGSPSGLFANETTHPHAGMILYHGCMSQFIFFPGRTNVAKCNKIFGGEIPDCLFVLEPARRYGIVG
jgi:hypothetical protein